MQREHSATALAAHIRVALAAAGYGLPTPPHYDSESGELIFDAILADGITAHCIRIEAGTIAPE